MEVDMPATAHANVGPPRIQTEAPCTSCGILLNKRKRTVTVRCTRSSPDVNESERAPLLRPLARGAGGVTRPKITADQSHRLRATKADGPIRNAPRHNVPRD